MKTHSELMIEKKAEDEEEQKFRMFEERMKEQEALFEFRRQKAAFIADCERCIKDGAQSFRVPNHNYEKIIQFGTLELDEETEKEISSAGYIIEILPVRRQSWRGKAAPDPAKYYRAEIKLEIVQKEKEI